MLELNAQMWEKEGRMEITLSDQSSSPQPQHRLSSSSDIQFSQFVQSSHSNSSMSYTEDQSKNLCSTPQNKSYSANVLEPQTQNAMPLPLYSHQLLIRTQAEHSSTSPSYFPELSYPAAKSEEEYEEDYDDEPFVQTTTFINEPQFHHTYKPQIARKRRRGNLPKEVTEFLKHWLILHKKHPYPTEREKQALADETGLMVNQISNWFINARRRILQPLLESENRQVHRAESSSTSTPVGVNVVGGSSNHTAPSGTHGNIDTTGTNVSTTNSGNYYPHHHHNYTHRSNIDTSRLLLQQPTTEDESNDTKMELVEQDSNIPPPWVLLPTKLPSMNILEKDLEAFEPRE